jgi:agmatine/peptidylarginine deiminase
LQHGHLAGDDTDSHIDTLARFCPDNVIVYMACDDPADEHFDDLQRMREELENLRTVDGQPYQLLPIPLPAPILDDEQRRLPASYVNFLIINGAVLLPVYGDPKADQIAQTVMQQAFPNHQIHAINCKPLILQNGSLHCITMHIPSAVTIQPC